ncbi:MAG: hypothetical protein EAZ09_09730 [Oscillatoriales cyanobacterium]|nr:MAG: hypothetical protein EAZ18_06195 [Oscillatoriales cyanobacterium]TAH22857.1 MAG: hypothetical protein EAZ09_09730 [Oscillatoriales cyanobacterium]
MMEDDDQKDSRRASAQSFFESLDELFDYIEASSNEPAQPQSPTVAPKSSSQPKKARPAKINLSDFEDAIADLEQFIQKKHQKRPESNQ